MDEDGPLPLGLSYVLPLKSDHALLEEEITGYLHWLSGQVREVIVVDGSGPWVFEAHHAAWGHFLRHVPVDPDLVTPMGKVGGVLTGLRHASNELAIIADDDVRYDEEALRAVLERLSDADVVRP